MTFLLVSLAGAAGAVFRYLTSGWVQTASGSDFPWGTFTVNAVGSLAMGLILGSGSRDRLMMQGAVGFLAGFTTFSTWMIETVRLGPRSARTLVNLLVSMIGGVAATAAGFTLTS